MIKGHLATRGQSWHTVCNARKGPMMDTADVDRPIMTDLKDESVEPESETPLQPWLRRFASVVGFASAGVASPGGSQMFS